MFLRQFLDPDSSTFTYIVGCPETKQAGIIDPVLENLNLYLTLLSEWQYSLLYSLETHTHADHITAASQLRQATNCQILIAKESLAKGFDKQFSDNENITIGKLILKAIHTPGHTDDCYSFLLNGCVFTGDALLIRATGRTDFQSGDAKQSYHSITKKLLTLPNNTLLYPGHDYKVLNVSTIGEEKQFNPRIQGKSMEEYIKIMENLNLPKPNKLDRCLID